MPASQQSWHARLVASRARLAFGAPHFRLRSNVAPRAKTQSSDGCGAPSALQKCSIITGCGTRIMLRGLNAPRILRPLPLLRFAVSATGGAHLCSIQYYLRFWLSSCRTSLAVSALRIMRYCLKAFFFVFWFPIFAAFRNGQDRSLQNVLGRIANLQNIRRALRPQARFGGQPP